MKALIIFPLTILFVLALINTPLGFDEEVGQTFVSLRNINQTALTNITERVEYIYDDTYNPIFYFYWEADFVNDTAYLLDGWYGEYKEHENQALELFKARRDNESALTEVQVYEIIKYDPKTIEETEQLQGFGLSLSGTDKLFVGMFLGAISISAVLGIRIFGSGISETSISIIYRLLVLFLLWSVLSLLTYDLFLEIPNNLGIVIWTILTFIYMIGGFLSSFNRDD